MVRFLFLNWSRFKLNDLGLVEIALPRPYQEKDVLV
jgi:hypothetical protein